MGKNESAIFVVTGGASGLGAASAHRLGRRGTLLMIDVNATRLELVAAQLRSEGIQVETRVCDISDEQSISSLAETTASLGRLAGIVHAAGISPRMADWRRVLIVNLVGTGLLLRALLPLAEPGTAAVCIASNAAHYPLKRDLALEAVLDDPLASDFLSRIEPFISTTVSMLPPGLPDPLAGAAYCLSKRGVIRLCERLSPAWALRGARIVSISPGPIDTPMGQLELPNLGAMLEQTPIRRLGRPEEIAAVIDFLCSTDASYITGTDLLVDGGFTGAMAHVPGR